MVRAVEGTPGLIWSLGVWSWAVSGNTKLQAPDAGYLNIIIVPLYCILL